MFIWVYVRGCVHVCGVAKVTTILQRVTQSETGHAALDRDRM